MNENLETVIYESNGVKITNLRAVFGAKTYSISNITSVESKTIEPNGCVTGVLVMVGVFMIMFGIVSIVNKDPLWALLVLGLFFAGGGFALYRTAKPTYSVNLTTSAGEVRAHDSYEWSEIGPIVEALNNAIIQKG